jgi:predicted transposase YbfD/YdcC
VLGQQACEAKSNEITAIPLLPDRLAIRGALVTSDAMGGAGEGSVRRSLMESQRRVPNQDRPEGARPRGRLPQANVSVQPARRKENWPNLHAEVERAFDDPALGASGTTGLLRHDTTDADHGSVERRRSPGTEVRRHTVSHDVSFLQTGRRFPGDWGATHTNRFPGLKAIAMVEAEVERGGKTTRERRFYLSSLALDATLLAHAVRSHWHIENRLHWVLDVVFHEDLSRLRSGHGPQNMATVRPHRPQPAAWGQRQAQPQNPTQISRLECRLPRNHHTTNRVTRFKRSPWAEAAIGRFKQVIGNGLRSRTDRRRATEMDVTFHALNRMLEFGRPISVRIA